MVQTSRNDKLFFLNKNWLRFCCYPMMIPYQNSAGNSGVVAYKLGADHIDVQFVDGAVYVYTNKSAGAANVKHMKQLAKQGRGLSTFISTTVKNRYAEKRSVE